MPPGMKNAINSWKKLNPDYSHQYYDDNDVTNYVRNFDCTHFKFDNNKLQTAFNKIKSGAGKADIFRYLIMYPVFKKPHVFKEHYRLDSIERYTGPFVMDYSIRKLIKLSLKDNYKRGEHTLTFNNIPYKIYLSPENFQNKYAIMRYANYHKELKNLKLTYWTNESQLFNK